MTDTAQVQLAHNPEPEAIWSENADAEELERLFALHPSDLYVTVEDDPRYVCGYIEEVTVQDDGTRLLTLTDPMGVRILEPDESVLVGVAGRHAGHAAWLTRAWYCDTCDSPLCDLA